MSAKKKTGTSMPTDVDDFLDEMRTSLGLFDHCIDFIDEAREDTAYVGFNPKAVAKLFLTRQPVKDSKRDLAFLVMLFHERGSHLSKMLKKVSDKGKKLIVEYRQKYSLADNAKSAGSTNGLTLPRIALTFAVQSVYYCINHRQNDPIKGDLPAWSKTQAFASLIPTTHSGLISEDTVSALKTIHLTAMTTLTRKINKSDSNPEESARFYLDLGIENGMLSDRSRVQALKDLGILRDNGEFVDEDMFSTAGTEA